MRYKKSYFVYIMVSDSGTLYVGVTNNLFRRVWEHKNGLNEGFTKKYHCNKLVYYEETEDILLAIQREKEIKGWSRMKKVHLIQEMNFSWIDLSKDLFEYTE